VETISHPVFEEVAQQLLCANHVRIKPGYKGQCVYPEHTRFVPPTIPYVPTQKWSGETQPCRVVKIMTPVALWRQY
jgi:hypothetical protein